MIDLPKRKECGLGSEEFAALLSGREERAACQKLLLALCEGGYVVQISLNVPGMPKRVENEEAVIGDGARLFSACLRREVRETRVLTGVAGMALLLLYDLPSPEEAKLCAVDVEEGAPWRRVLDIDVITDSGPLSRSDIGLPPRRCLICDAPAKLCARSGSHSLGELREAFFSLSNLFNSDTSMR